MKVFRCADCGLPFATLQNGALVVQSVHSGRKHVNAISARELIRLLEEDQGLNETQEAKVACLASA